MRCWCYVRNWSYYWPMSSQSSLSQLLFLLLLPKRHSVFYTSAILKVTRYKPLYNKYIIMSCCRHGYPWTSLATSPYRWSPQAGLQDHNLYPHIAAGCMFVLVVLLLPGHMRVSIGVHHLWARPCFSNSDLHVWFA